MNATQEKQAFFAARQELHEQHQVELQELYARKWRQETSHPSSVKAKIDALLAKHQKLIESKNRENNA